MRLSVLALVFLLVVQIYAEKPLTVRAKRQQCQCIRNPNGGMTCSCIKPSVDHGETLFNAESQQQAELAHELQNIQSHDNNAQARCACLQIVFHGNPQYQCQCGDNNGNPLPTTTTPVTTTTTAAPTTTTTHLPEPVHTTTQGHGQCQCIMIRISGPASAHYQCNCLNQQGSNTTHQMISQQVFTTQPPMTTHAPEIEVTLPVEPIPQPLNPETSYPLTTTCIMYVGGQTSNACSCLPKYDQCAQHICCLQAKYRSYKTSPVMNDSPKKNEPTTIDMLMNVLQKIKTKLDN
ncbi:unnamed protein product [Auanema sp. JU1783]|nr:unnamed protein product [Auanema sp. JU1783]